MECGNEPLQFYWFRSVVKLYDSMLKLNKETLSRVLKADLRVHSCAPSCWTAFQVLYTFQGFRRCNSFVQAVRQGTSTSIQEFTDDLRRRLRTVWRCWGMNPQDTNSKFAYKSLFAMPTGHTVRAPPCLPKHMHLDMSQHVLRNVGRFRLWTHTLAETAPWDHANSLLWDRCACKEIQDFLYTFLFYVHQFQVSFSFCFFCLARCSFRLFPNFRWDALRGIHSDATLPYLVRRSKMKRMPF